MTNEIVGQKILTRFYEDENRCWVWVGAVDGRGYGNVKIGQKWFRTHRLSYLIFVEDLIKGLVIDHICRNKLCMNPNHLEQVTQQTNLHRGNTNINKRICKNGHPFDDKNTRYTSSGSRQCRRCHNIRQKRYDKQRKELVK